jgi:hypothetical protein
MKINFTALKNYISIFKQRYGVPTFLLSGISKSEFEDLLNSIDKSLDLISKEFEDIDARLSKLESKRSVPKNQSVDTLIDIVLNKISILKNIIEARMVDKRLFSVNLITVESIEQEIRDTRTITKTNLEKLNEIYLIEIKNQI